MGGADDQVHARPLGGDTGADKDAIKALPVNRMGGQQCPSGGGDCGLALGAVVPGQHLRAACLQGGAGAVAGFAKAENENGLGSELGECNHRLTNFQGGQANQRQHKGNDPEADHDCGFFPAFFLEVVVDGGHQENAFAGTLEVKHLQHHR